MLSIWAHYDDDLIFGNPTISSAVAAGAAVTTFFLTASDAGRDVDYTVGREKGIRLAYERMHGAPLRWEKRESRISGGATVTTWRADAAPITLSTLGLPDGRPNGTGFPVTGNMSLRQLLEGDREDITPLGGGTALTADGLTALLAELLDEHAGADVLAHAPMSAGPWAREDHSDHWSTGEFVRRAARHDERISWRIGYPSAKLPPNLSGAALEEKVDIFRVYAAHDPVVARDDVAETLALRGFGEWLRRGYELRDGTPTPV